jgi:SNF2 family DNA or RNA helicase|tara:strand:+ start:467 stop:2038 length:1572 start_codon:yes stop_codon:yes gene_type:complete
MLVWKDKHALILKLREPSKILNVIPSAKQFSVKKVPYVAVPHKIAETRLLRNLGYNAPTPISVAYDWPGRYQPFDAQREAAAFLTMNERAFNLSELGTGKSLASLWAYDYLRSVGQLNKVLVISPLSTLERTWADEVFHHFPHLECAVLHGSRDKRIKLLNTDVDVYVVNHDGLQIIEPHLKNRTDIDLIIVDEIAQAARNAGTDRWKAINKVVNKHSKPRSCWGMTGTPTPNAPTDAWAQCRLIVPDKVPPYFNRFKGEVMKQLSQFTWVPKPEATEKVHEAMQPAVRFTRDECVDLPPLMYETRQVGLTKEQGKAYKEMVNKLRTEAEEGEITAVNEAVKMAKLVQIACGVVYANDGSEVTIPSNPRVEETREIVHQAEGKVIVFVPFVSSVKMVAEELAKDFSVEVIHGGVKKQERDRIFGAFQKSKEPKVIVAQPAAMSHGLTLTSASTIIWYSCVTSNEVFEQANGRINRPGQKMNNFIIMLEGTPVEKRIYSRLKNKQKMQGALLDEVKAQRTSLAA